jgi:hypothetical protein
VRNVGASGDRERLVSVQARLRSPLFEEIEAWRRAQRPKIPPRTDALRELLRRGLDAEQRPAWGNQVEAEVA